jgi:putative MATE family efflux protein
MSLVFDKPFYRNVFTLALPIMLQNLINAFVNMVDTAMIGSLGTVEIAAVGFGNEIFFLCNMFCFGICSGGSIFIAQFWGKRDLAGARKAFGLCLCLSFLMGSLFTIAAGFFPREVIGLYTHDQAVIEAGAAYLNTLTPSFIPFAISFVFTTGLRSTERVRLPMITTIIALSVNVTLNYLLIFGHGPFPALGVVGAAYGTLAARLVEVLILVFVTYGKRMPIAGRLRELFAFDGSFVRQFMRIVAPVMANEILWSLGATSQSLIMGRTNTEAAAAFNILHNVSNLTWVVFQGIGAATGVMVGKAIGAGRSEQARVYARRLTRLAFFTAIFVAMLLYPLSLGLPLVFNVGQEVLSLTSLFLLLLGLSYPFNAYNMTMIIGVCRAGGDTAFCTFYDLFFLWCFAIPAAALASFVFHLPPVLVYLCFALENPLKAIIGVLRFRSGKWLRKLV